MSPLMKQCIGTRHERCTELIPVGQKRCAKHARDEQRRHSTRKNQKPQMQVYQSSKWRRETRPAILERDLHTCECGHRATHVDHYPVPLSQCEARRIDPHDHSNLRALCASCAGRADGHRSQEQPWIG
jgi:5-methylcytosine-specific restriction endonuclease McrA